MDAPNPPGRDPTPEACARQVIDPALTTAGWIVQDREGVNLHAGPGIAVRETPTATGPADYRLFLDGRACGASRQSRTAPPSSVP
jgi:type I restriction enzyme R subunit